MRDRQSSFFGVSLLVGACGWMGCGGDSGSIDGSGNRDAAADASSAESAAGVGGSGGAAGKGGASGIGGNGGTGGITGGNGGAGGTSGSSGDAGIQCTTAANCPQPGGDCGDVRCDSGHCVYFDGCVDASIAGDASDASDSDSGDAMLIGNCGGGGASCPATPPATGISCGAADLCCNYQAASTLTGCVCASGKWSCAAQMCGCTGSSIRAPSCTSGESESCASLTCGSGQVCVAVSITCGLLGSETAQCVADPVPRRRARLRRLRRHGLQLGCHVVRPLLQRDTVRK